MSASYSHIKVEEQHEGMRLDKFLAEMLEGYSRSRLQSLIQDGHVKVNTVVQTKRAFVLEIGNFVEVVVPEAVEAEPQAQNIPLDIVYEDDDLLVINKPAGLVVHPGAGNQDGTLVNALLHHCKDSLSGIGGVLRPGIVHRLDKDTSGLMLAAKNDFAHQHLSAQLQSRELSRIYKAFVFKIPLPPLGVIDKPIGRHSSQRIKMAVNPKNGREAVTEYKTLGHLGEALSLVECKLQTGRTHQIRVHMESLKNPIIGDDLYGPQPNAVESALKNAECDDRLIGAVLGFSRQALHAHSIAFIHPRSEEEMEFESEFPDDFQYLMDIARDKFVFM